mgnify:FL=1
MSIIIFIVILAVLILVHELGHFFVAKSFGIRVDEFGIGYPPRALTLFEWRRTRFTLNWLPFGGFVKIFGENGEVPAPEHQNAELNNSESESEAKSEHPDAEPESEKSFAKKPRFAQALVLIAGVAFNIIFAWVLISAGFMVGLPTSTSTVTAGREVENARLVITMVAPDSPAFIGGLKSGDVITDIVSIGDLTGKDNLTGKIRPKTGILSPESVSDFIAKHGNEKINISYSRGSETDIAVLTPSDGIIEGRKAIGISMDMIGTLSLPIHLAFFEGAKTTVSLTKLVTVGLAVFVYDAVRGASDFSQVTGPVGIVGLVGDASRLGLIYLISFTAFISINLAVINLIPFPALDGGRLLFVIIESIKRSPISPKISNVMNTVGFMLLIILMILVTVHDVVKLF